MRKRLFLFTLIVVIIAINAIGINFNYNKNNKLSALALANIEALAGFEFNGQSWDTDTVWYGVILGGVMWHPVLTDCTQNSGGITVNIGPIGISGGSHSWTGQMVTCMFGAGNCFDGTGCLPKQS